MFTCQCGHDILIHAPSRKGGTCHGCEECTAFVLRAPLRGLRASDRLHVASIATWLVRHLTPELESNVSYKAALLTWLHAYLQGRCEHPYVYSGTREGDGEMCDLCGHVEERAYAGNGDSYISPGSGDL